MSTTRDRSYFTSVFHVCAKTRLWWYPQTLEYRITLISTLFHPCPVTHHPPVSTSLFTRTSLGHHNRVIISIVLSTWLGGMRRVPIHKVNSNIWSHVYALQFNNRILEIMQKTPSFATIREPKLHVHFEFQFQPRGFRVYFISARLCRKSLR